MNSPLWLHRLWQELHRLANHSRPVLYQGVDISEHNGYVDFNALKGKIDFAILRCGYGSDYISQDDSCFQRNAEACDAAGIPYGVYLYSYATDESMARNEAAHTLRLLRGRDPDFGVWYDIEDSCLPYGEGVAAQCKIYCDTLLAAGCTCVGIYAPLYLMEDYLSGPELKPYDKWVAQWNWTCDYPEPGIWQYTSEGVIGGQTFDMNYVYKDYPELTGGNMTQQ